MKNKNKNTVKRGYAFYTLYMIGIISIFETIILSGGLSIWLYIIPAALLPLSIVIGVILTKYNWFKKIKLYRSSSIMLLITIPIIILGSIILIFDIDFAIKISPILLFSVIISLALHLIVSIKSDDY